MDVIGSAINNIRNAAGNLFGNIGNAVGNEIHQLPSQIGNFAQQQFNSIPQVQQFNNIRQFTQTPQFQQGFQNVSNAISNNPVTRYIGSQPLISQPGINILPQPKMPTIGNYVQGQVVKPLEQGLTNIFQAKNIPQAIQGGLQTAGGVFGATPQGAAFNISRGAIAGGINAVKGQPLDQALTQGITQNPSIGSAITKNPFIATGIDLASANPEGIANTLSKGEGIINSLKGISPKAFNIHPEDQKVLTNIIGTIQAGGKIADEDKKTLQLLAEHYLGQKYAVGSTGKIAKTFDYFLAKQNGGIPGRLPAPAYLTSVKSNPETLSQAEQIPVQQQLPLESPMQSPTQTSTQISSGGNIPQQMTKVEAKNVATNLGLQGKSPTVPTGEKPLGLVDTVQNSAQTTEPLQETIQGAYNVAGNKQTLAAAQQRIAADPNGAYQFATSTHNAEANATAILLAKQYELNGQPEMAANLMMQKAKQALEAGQGNQIYSMWDKLSPETVGQTAAQTIADYNVTAKNKIPALTAEQYQGFVNKAKEIQAMTDPRQKGIATQQLLTSIGRLIPSSKVDQAVSLWRAGLLTGFRTPGKVIVSHMVGSTLGLEKAKDIPASIIDRGLSLVTGKRSTSFTLRGNINGFKQGTLDAVDNLVHGYNAPNSGGVAQDFTRQINFGNSWQGKVAQAYVDGIGRLHGSLYKPFFGAAHMNSLYDQAITEAGNQGLKGVERNNFILNFVKNPPEVAQQQALKEAEYTTFQNKTMLGTGASGLVRGLGPAGRIIAPFTQIPASIAMKLVDYSPVGAVKTVIQQIADGHFDQRTFAQGIGRAATGTGVMAIGAALYNQGLMTLGYPTTPSEQAQWQAEGKKEYSVLVNGKWRSLETLGPAGAVIAVGGAWAQGMQGNQKTPGNLVNAGIQAGSTGLAQIANAPYLSGVNVITSTLQDPARSWTKLAQNYVGSVVPTAMSNIAAATDPYQRQSVNKTKQLTTALTNNIPGLREMNPAQLDVFGNPVPRANGMVGALLDPFYSSTNKTSPLLGELQRLTDAGYPAFPAPLTKNQTINGVKQVLTPDQLDTLTKQSGPQVEQALNDLIQSPDYQSLDDQEKANAISSTIASVRQQVRGGANLDNSGNPSPITNNSTGGTNPALAYAKQQATYTLLNPNTGTARTVTLGTPIAQPQYTGNTALDSKLAANYNSQINSQISNVVGVYNAGKISAGEAAARIQGLQSQLVSTKGNNIGAVIGPTSGSGGFNGAAKIKSQIRSSLTRTRKYRVKRAKAPKMARFKVKPPKLAQISLNGAQKFKVKKLA